MNKIEQGGIILLRMDGGEIFFSVPPGESPKQNLRAGSVAGILTMLGTSPITAPKIETAIASVEELIMPALRPFGRKDHLQVSGPELVGVMRQFADGSDAVPIAAIEALFNRVADVASGSPLRAHETPLEPGWVLGLIVLREVMHHGGHASVSVFPGQL